MGSTAATSPADEEQEQQERAISLAANATATEMATQQLLLEQQQQEQQNARAALAAAAGYPTSLLQYLQQQQQQEILRQQREEQLCAALLNIPGVASAVHPQQQPAALGSTTPSLDGDNRLLLQLLQESQVSSASQAGAAPLSQDLDLLAHLSSSSAAINLDSSEQAACSTAIPAADNRKATTGDNEDSSRALPPVSDIYAENGILGPWSATSAGLLGKMVATGITEANSQQKPRRVRKKPKDKPKRPLSAYNIFFKEERQRILETITQASPSSSSDKDNIDKTEDSSSNNNRKRKKSPHGKIGFENLARTIGQRWQQLSEDQVEYYKTQAATDMSRYKAEMEIYLSKQQQRKNKSSGDGTEEQDDDGLLHSGGGVDESERPMKKTNDDDGEARNKELA